MMAKSFTILHKTLFWIWVALVVLFILNSPAGYRWYIAGALLAVFIAYRIVNKKEKGSAGTFTLIISAVFFGFIAYLIAPTTSYKSIEHVKYDIESAGPLLRMKTRVTDVSGKYRETKQFYQRTFDESGLNESFKAGNREWNGNTVVKLEPYIQGHLKPVVLVKSRISATPQEKASLQRMVHSGYSDARVVLLHDTDRRAAMEEAAFAQSGMTEEANVTIGNMSVADYIMNINIESAGKSGYRLRFAVIHTNHGETVLSRSAYCSNSSELAQFIRRIARQYEVL